MLLLLLSAFDVLSTFYQLFINFLSTFINFYQHFITILSTFINFLSTLSFFINFLSTFYQLFINFLSPVYRLFISLEEMITFDICETLFALLPGHTMFLVLPAVAGPESQHTLSWCPGVSSHALLDEMLLAK